MDRSLLFTFGFKLFYFVSFILLEEATIASVGEGPSITLIMNLMFYNFCIQIKIREFDWFYGITALYWYNRVTICYFSIVQSVAC
jgi:hypothetical protein